jgi:hypothetical protein
VQRNDRSRPDLRARCRGRLPCGRSTGGSASGWVNWCLLRVEAPWLSTKTARGVVSR